MLCFHMIWMILSTENAKEVNVHSVRVFFLHYDDHICLHNVDETDLFLFAYSVNYLKTKKHYAGFSHTIQLAWDV